jgi:7-carboxy-7-deazaguanine synthase
MHVPHVLELVKRLKEKKYYINIEAAGTRVVNEIFDLVDFISFDLKTPSSNVKTPLNLIAQLNSQFQGKFQIKAVIENQADFIYTLNAFKKLQIEENQINAPWVLTPAYNTLEEFPLNRFMQVLSWNEEAGGHFRVIGQQHKWIFGPDQKQV